MSIEPSQMISHETIRSRLKRRVRWTAGIGFGAFLLALFGPLAGLPAEYGYLVAIGPLVFTVALISLYWIAKCPKCDTRLGQELSYRLAFTIFSKKVPNFCPYCGVSLDTPCPD